MTPTTPSPIPNQAAGEPKCTCAVRLMPGQIGATHSEDCPITAWVRAAFKASGESASGRSTAPTTGSAPALDKFLYVPPTSEAQSGWNAAIVHATAHLQSTASPAASVLTDAARDVLGERQRQVTAEGWTPEHDDEHDMGELSHAAAWYAVDQMMRTALDNRGLGFWPWAQKWWKPTTPRRDLVKAGALILAEIERMDRIAASMGGDRT